MARVNVVRSDETKTRKPMDVVRTLCPSKEDRICVLQPILNLHFFH